MPLPATFREFENLSAQQMLDRASRTLPRAILVLVVVAIAWQLVQLTWMILDRPSQAATIQPSAVAPPPLPPTDTTDIQAVIGAHLFGVPKPPEEVNPANAPPIQTNLVLAGLWTDENDPKQGTALIGESAATARAYPVGAMVRPGTTLYAVYVDRAILKTGEKLESLILPRTATPESAFAPLQAAAGGGSPGSQLADNLRRIAETNPSAFAEIVRPQPVFANGVQRGYRVYPGRNRQQFAKLGLEPGDLILTINGTPLDDPQRGMEIFNTMGSSDQVSVTVERSGQMQELTLNTGLISIPGGGAGAVPGGAKTPPPPPPGVQAPLE
jgi:general secretion pathway protein C